ncbi:hypothetical protein MRX96_050244 [Rhipicephalus microplus]
MYFLKSRKSKGDWPAHFGKKKEERDDTKQGPPLPLHHVRDGSATVEVNFPDDLSHVTVVFRHCPIFSTLTVAFLLFRTVRGTPIRKLLSHRRESKGHQRTRPPLACEDQHVREEVREHELLRKAVESPHEQQARGGFCARPEPEEGCSGLSLHTSKDEPDTERHRRHGRGISDEQRGENSHCLGASGWETQRPDGIPAAFFTALQGRLDGEYLERTAGISRETPSPPPYTHTQTQKNGGRMLAKARQGETVERREGSPGRQRELGAAGRKTRRHDSLAAATERKGRGRRKGRSQGTRPSFQDGKEGPC